MERTRGNPVLRELFRIFAALALTACAQQPSPSAPGPVPLGESVVRAVHQGRSDADGDEVVRVTNHNWSDVVVYLSVSGVRHRLGLVPTAGRSVFRISSAGLATARDLRLVVDPVGVIDTFTTEAIPWTRGQDIQLTVQRVLRTTHFMLVLR